MDVCSICQQMDVGQTGEYPCSECGLPTVWDDMEPNAYLAALAHVMWAGWMRYLFKFGVQHSDGRFTMNADQVTQWQRQMQTTYHALSKGEQQLDLAEAARILWCLDRIGVLSRGEDEK